MGANEPRAVANLDPRGMVGRIYVGDHLTSHPTKLLALSLMVSEKTIFEGFFNSYIALYKQFGSQGLEEDF